MMTGNNARYQYSHVDLEEVIANPEEYIIPACLPACEALWGKNIETFMASNEDDDYLYVLLGELDDNNTEIMTEIMKLDPRFFFTDFRKAFGIKAHGVDDKAMQELLTLTEVFRMQDTFRFQSTEQFLSEYKRSGEIKYSDTINPDGTVNILSNSNEEISFEMALKKSGKTNLYVPLEGRVYQSSMYLNWHNRYLDFIKNNEHTRKK